MYIVNGFIYIGAALVLLGFHSMAGQGQMIKSYYLAFIQELNGESYSGMVRLTGEPITANMVKWGASSRWSFGPNSTWGSK